MEEKGRFDKKVVIVTGASSGIGATTAVAFANEGAKIAIVGRNQERLADTAKKCKSVGAEVLEILAELRKFENLKTVIQQAVNKFGRLDILVNNAGCGEPTPVEEANLQDYEEQFQVNVRAPFFLSKYALAHLKETKGCIVNIGSVTAVSGLPGMTVCYMTKSAIEQFTKSFAAECAPFGVRVTCVAPGAVDTGFKSFSGMTDEEKKEVAKEYLKTQPLGFIEPENVADAILYLSSSSMVTGVSLVIDGGKLCSV